MEQTTDILVRKSEHSDVDEPASKKMKVSKVHATKKFSISVLYLVKDYVCYYLPIIFIIAILRFLWKMLSHSWMV